AGMKISRIAEAKNVHIIPHNPLGPISTMAALQIDSVVPNFEVQEWPSGNWADYITTEDIRIENGYAILPGGPGLGVNIVDDVDVKHPFGGRKPSWTVHEDGSIVDR
ncbi:MAG: galactokinase, partial [Clostridia bacterium]|nr:galactokinase [Clostridia bacterium]